MSMVNTLPKREEMDPAFFWRMEDLYPSDQDWEEEYLVLENRISDLAQLKGTLKKGGKELLNVLQKKDEVNKLFERVYVYANQRYHQDTGNQVYQAMTGRSMALMTRLSDATAYLEPEILELEPELLVGWMKEEPELQIYRRFLEEQLRTREHILSAEMESVLAKAGEMGSSPQEIFTSFNNADLTFGTVKNDAGKEIMLTHGRYISFMESRNREVRKEAFETLYKAYEDHKNTLAACFNANLKQAAFFAGMRKYPSALEASLDEGNIPVSVYDNLIRAVHESMDSMYSYVQLRKKLLGVDTLHMYDVYAPMVEYTDKEISFEEAKKLVKEGLSVLGEEYGSILQEGFDNGWIDVYENQGKRSGAYSWGAYGTHPYVLLNYSGNLNAVFTLAHEMGHAIHSYYSDRTQPYVYAGYRIFVAEVASTCNEALLIHYLMEKADSKEEKAYLINYFLDQFKGTLFRQTMFAEFEKLMHQRFADEGSIPAQSICDLYYELNQQYFGPDMEVDSQIAMEWSRIPHFYTPFYVYQYATGFSAAIAISSKILAGEEGIVEKFRQFLSGGSSMDPIDLLKLCGVDMTTGDAVTEALRVFREYVSKLEKLV
ncbi:MAG: oligoendopeptidase F [Lachnospiraceae bacterium]|nr:oligoendopeptidase F [Lachnospiraceae bacterium]